MSRLFQTLMTALVVLMIGSGVKGANDEAEYIADAFMTQDVEVLYEVVMDEGVSPACRVYADTLLSGLFLIKSYKEYPDSYVGQILFSIVLDALPKAKFDCEVSI